MKRISSFLILLGGMLILPGMVQAQPEPKVFNPKAPNIYTFENDTLKQELKFIFMTNMQAYFVLNCENKIHKENYKKSGICELARASKLQHQDAVPDTLTTLTFRSVYKKYPLELQLDSRRRFARVFVPEVTPEQHFCPLASVGLLKKQSGNPTWEQGGISDFVLYIAKKLCLPDSISFEGAIMFTCTINAEGVLTGIEFPDRSKQKNPKYPIVERLLSEVINTVPYWEPGYADGAPTTGVVQARILIDTNPVKHKSATNPMDAVYPKTDPFTTMSKGRLRDQQKVLLLEYPKETTNTKPYVGFPRNWTFFCVNLKSMTL